MSKQMIRSVFTITLLLTLMLCSSSASASRPEPTLHADLLPQEDESVGGCEGRGEEDCLTKRTLAAHLDYIYTQQHNKKP